MTTHTLNDVCWRTLRHEKGCCFENSWDHRLRLVLTCRMFPSVRLSRTNLMSDFIKHQVLSGGHKDSSCMLKFIIIIIIL